MHAVQRGYIDADTFLDLNAGLDSVARSPAVSFFTSLEKRFGTAGFVGLWHAPLNPKVIDSGGSGIARHMALAHQERLKSSRQNEFSPAAGDAGVRTKVPVDHAGGRSSPVPLSGVVQGVLPPVARRGAVKT